MTNIFCTFIYITVAYATIPSFWAFAGKAVDFIYACGFIFTRRTFTFVYVNFAITARKSWLALTGKVINPIHTSSTVLTPRLSTIVDVCFAVIPRDPDGASTIVKAIEIHTRSVILARMRIAFVYLRFAFFTSPSLFAEAAEVTGGIRTVSPHAWPLEAFVNVFIASWTRPSS